MRTGMDSTYSLGYHCPKCGRKIHNPKRNPPKCCGRAMVNDFDPRLVVRVDPATVTAAEFKNAVRAKHEAD